MCIFYRFQLNISNNERLFHQNRPKSLITKLVESAVALPTRVLSRAFVTCSTGTCSAITALLHWSMQCYHCHAPLEQCCHCLAPLEHAVISLP